MKCSPDAMTSTKELIKSIEGLPINDELRMFTAKQLSIVRESKDGQEGMGAFLEKRKPSWMDMN